MEKNKLVAQVNLSTEGVVVPLYIVLNECQNAILYALRLNDKTTQLPAATDNENNAINLKIGKPPETLDEQKNLLKNWLIKKGFEDFAKGVKLALIEAYYYGFMLENNGKNTTLKKLLSEIQMLRERANEQSLPGLFSKLNPYLARPLNYIEHVTSINNARNCLIHANGIVTKRHCNDEKKEKLVIKGNRFIFFWEKEDGKRVPLKIGVISPPNTPLKMAAEMFEISFDIGDVIQFTINDFNDFITTCLYFALDLQEALKKKR